MIGDWLENSGWISVLCEVDIVSLGIVDLFFKVFYVKWIRYVYEVIVCFLYILMKCFYDRYIIE